MIRLELDDWKCESSLFLKAFTDFEEVTHAGKIFHYFITRRVKNAHVDHIVIGGFAMQSWLSFNHSCDLNRDYFLIYYINSCLIFKNWIKSDLMCLSASEGYFKISNLSW